MLFNIFSLSVPQSHRSRHVWQRCGHIKLQFSEPRTNNRKCRSAAFGKRMCGSMWPRVDGLESHGTKEKRRQSGIPFHFPAAMSLARVPSNWNCRRQKPGRKSGPSTKKLSQVCFEMLLLPKQLKSFQLTRAATKIGTCNRHLFNKRNKQPGLRMFSRGLRCFSGVSVPV